MNTAHKIVSLKELEGIVQDLKSKGKKIVVTNGAFDMLHVGHKLVLEESKKLGDILIVGVNSDTSVKSSKSDLRPIISENERAELVAALACVDFVSIFEEKEPINFLKTLRPDIYTKGGDYDISLLDSTAWVKDNVGKSVIIPGRIQYTTKIIEKILKIYE